MAKSLTYDQVASRKDKAERFDRDFLGDDNRADQIADENVEQYADRRGFDIVDNPTRRRNRSMANDRTKRDMQDEIDDLQAENDALQAQLDCIADVLDQGSGDDDDDDSDDQ